VPEEHHSPHSAWETPDPGFWTKHGYAVVRTDEAGTGQSPGVLDTMSRSTSEAFFDVCEWASEQSWSSGKVGLLGISYYAGSQWRVAARQPKGLACIIPWEGMSDYYRDRCRHGGILSNTFISFWWNRQVRPHPTTQLWLRLTQVVTNQYGRPDRASRGWGYGTIEGDLDETTLTRNRRDQNIDNANNQYRDQEYYASKEYDMGDIKVPLLSVGVSPPVSIHRISPSKMIELLTDLQNWGGILLHLRGNVEGYLNAGSEMKYIRFITGRHDLPFYSKENVEMQMSFLDAFLKGDDRGGWTNGTAPKVGITLRKGNVGYNDAEAERQYPSRYEDAWPIPRTQYTKYYLTSSGGLTTSTPSGEATKLSYEAPGTLKDPKKVEFTSEPFTEETEFTGHVAAHLCISCSSNSANAKGPSEIDIFTTLRHLDSEGKEICYTGTVGDPVPITKGWLRVSNRKLTTTSPRHKSWHPHREYLSQDVLAVLVDEVYEVDIEIWPTNVVMSPGDRLVFEVSSGDTQGAGLFEHTSESDRPREKLSGWNNVHFGAGRENWVLMPMIPAKEG
jgi:predicted acyl esterase